MKENKINILYVGLHYNKEEEEMLLSVCKNGVSAAHYVFQQNVIKGIELFAQTKVIVSLPVGSFPFMSNKILLRSNTRFQYEEMGYLNLPIVKDVCIEVQIKHLIHKWIEKAGQDDDNYVLIYDAYLPFIKGAIKAREKCENKFKIACIIPDLPGEYSIEANYYSGVKKSLLDMKSRSFYKNIVDVDGYILLTEHMANAMRVSHKPFLVMEGMVDSQEESYYRNMPIIRQDKTVIMYAGELSNNVGIEQLISAFQMILDKNYELWICGFGALENFIKEQAATDERINFLGFIPKSDLKRLERDVDIFINPRQNIYEYTKYSFPSKNLECLKTGKPLIAYKLDGIPNEYDSYMFYPTDGTCEALSEKIVEVASLSVEKLQNIKERQITFIYKNKSNLAQGRRILEFIKGI